MKRFLIILIALISVGVILADKSQQRLDRERKQANKEIKETTKKISENERQTRKQINQLNQISAQIQEKNDAINRLKLSIDSIDDSMGHLNDSIAVLEQNLSVLRDKYAEVLRSIRATRHSTSNVAFIFSANSFSDAYRRIRYLRQFATWQTSKTQELKQAITSIDDAKNELVQLHSQKTSSMQQVTSTQIALKNDQKQQSQVVADLNKERATLNAYLKKKRQEAKQLDDQLNKLIAQQQKEAEKKRKEAERKRKEQEKRKKEQEKALAQKRKKGNKASSSTVKSEKKTEVPQAAQGEDLALNQPSKPKPIESIETSVSTDFERQKGLLPYPVDGRYRIVSKFGRQVHPQLRDIVTENPGIDIELLSGANAKAVFDGTVSAIFQNPGYHTIVMVRHGEYITIYANLSSINVRVEDKVKANQVIGTVYANPDDDNRRIIHFEVRKETKKLNPQQWIK